MMKKLHGLTAGALAFVLLGASCRSEEKKNPSASETAQSDAAQNNNELPAIQENRAPKVFPVGIVVPAGVIGYRVESYQFVAQLPGGAKPAAGRKFLLLKISMRNTGAKETPVATFKLVYKETEINLSEQGGKAPDSLNGLKQLAKDEGKSGVLVFEAPETKALRLKINAAPPVKDEMFVDLAQFHKGK
jgi:hypothetical protein